MQDRTVYDRTSEKNSRSNYELIVFFFIFEKEYVVIKMFNCIYGHLFIYV